MNLRRDVAAPDGREWIVRIVWWPRSQSYRDQMAFIDRGNPTLGWGASAAIFVVLIKSIFWPVVLAVRVTFRRAWLIEAFPRHEAHFEGYAWRVGGWRRSMAVVSQIADGISNGNRSPAPPDARPTRFARPHQRRVFRL